MGDGDQHPPLWHFGEIERAGAPADRVPIYRGWVAPQLVRTETIWPPGSTGLDEPYWTGPLLVWDQRVDSPKPVSERIRAATFLDAWFGDATPEQIAAERPQMAPVHRQVLDYLQDEANSTRRPQVADADVLTYATPQLLADFLDLDGADDDAYLSFARRWGPLGICKHGLFPAHAPGQSRCRAYEAAGLTFELVDAWRLWVTRANALLVVGGDVRAGKPGQPEHWRRVAALPPWQPEPSPGWEDECHEHASQLARWKNDGAARAVALGRDRLTDVLQAWTRAGGVETVLAWTGGRPVLRTESAYVTGLIGIQLMVTITRTDGITSCAGCGHPCLARRTGGRGPRRFCEKCRKQKVPQALAEHDRRTRIRAAKSEGQS